MHSLPEFDDPGRSSSPIDWDTLLKAVGWYGDDLIAIKQKLSGKAMFDDVPILVEIKEAPM